MSYFESPRPRLFAHRGASGTWPENTLEAFRAGLSAGATHLEMDVHATRDGRIVVHHDVDLERTTDATGPVRALSFTELQGVDAGYGFRDEAGHRCFAGRGIRVPALDEVLETFPDALLNVEIKQDEPPIAAEVVALVRRHGATERVLLAAEGQAIMDRIRAHYDGPTGFTADEAFEFHGRVLESRWEGYRPAGSALQVPPAYEGVEVVTPPLIAAARRCGVEVHVWTLNDADGVRHFVSLGVDGVMSDFPEMAARVIGHA